VSQYATIQDVKDFGIMPPEDVDALETQYPGFVVRQCVGVSSHFDTKLAKRYATPLGQVSGAYDPALVFNVVQQVVARLYLRRGYNPSSQQDQQIRKAYDDAEEWLRQAADPQSGLVELAGAVGLGSTGPGVTLGGPLSYSEASPYTAFDRQAAIVRGGGA